MSAIRAVQNDKSGVAARTVLPLNCALYRSTPVFTEATVPAGLLRSHRTAPGTWALIHVHEGQLLYRVLDPPSERLLEPSAAPGLIEPGVPHEVALIGPVRFQVVFHRIGGMESRDTTTAAQPQPGSQRDE